MLQLYSHCYKKKKRRRSNNWNCSWMSEKPDSRRSQSKEILGQTPTSVNGKVFHLTWDNPPPHSPDPSQQADWSSLPPPIISSLPPPLCQLYPPPPPLLLPLLHLPSSAPLLLIFLLLHLFFFLLLKAVQPPWVILTWWIIKPSETLAPSGHGGLMVEEERGGRWGGGWSDTLLNVAWGGVLWAGLWATAIHPSLTHTHTFAFTVLETTPSAPVHNMAAMFFPGIPDTVEQ